MKLYTMAVLAIISQSLTLDNNEKHNVKTSTCTSEDCDFPCQCFSIPSRQMCVCPQIPKFKSASLS